jgi:hypothetical protein
LAASWLHEEATLESSPYDESSPNAQGCTNPWFGGCSTVAGHQLVALSPAPKGKVFHPTLNIPLCCFIFSDVKSHEVVAIVWQISGSSHKGLLQECNCPTDQALNSNYNCTFTSMDNIARIMLSSSNKKESL